MCRNSIKTIVFWYLVLASTAWADDSFPFLKAKDQVYTNVTVTTVTPTDIYFTHAHGLASAKLKDLDPELRKHFHFNAATSARIEQANIQATADFQAKLARQKSESTPNQFPRRMYFSDNIPVQNGNANGPDFIAPRIKARSILGQKAPSLAVERWLTDMPATYGKFVLIDFWATWCGPCRRSISQLNDFQREFSDRLVVIGLSDEAEVDVRQMKSPVIDYAVAIDTEARMKRELEIAAIPHCILIDPTGVVRYEGNPAYLNYNIVKNFLDKYSQ